MDTVPTCHTMIKRLVRVSSITGDDVDAYSDSSGRGLMTSEYKDDRIQIRISAMDMCNHLAPS